MPDSTNRLKLPQRSVATSLDDVLAMCLSVMERGELLDRARISALYPQWSNELEEFFENWDAMERFSSQLSDCRRQLRDQTPPGTHVRYFGDYELIEEIGQGGMGIIYKARQISLDRVVALKMILDRGHDRERFRLEAELAASLEHPNIVSIYEVGEFEGHPYFTMQYVDGKNLSQSLDSGPLEPRTAAELTAQLASAVHYAHQRGVLHRDLKPANVLLDASGNPHVTDFGLAKQIECEEDLEQITETGAILGTPSYMSPEQARGQREQLTVATDVYGLGAILFALLTGRPPFVASSSLDILRRVVDQAPRSPRDIRASIPRDLETICLKCLEKDPVARYASAAALADDLQRYLRYEPIEARPVTSLERTWRWCRRNPTTAALVLSIVAVLVGTSIVTSVMARREHRAWLVAEEGRQREEGLRGRIAKAMKAETAARQQAVATLVDSFTTNGLLAQQQDDPSAALLWFQHAQSMSAIFPERHRQSEVRFQSWYAWSPEPVNVLQLEDAALRHLEFDATGRYLLCHSQGGALIWDLQQNMTLPIARTSPFKFARWHPHHPWLAVSDDSGRVTLLDAQNDTEIWSEQLDQVADTLAFSPDGLQLAAGHGTELTVWSGVPDKVERLTATHAARVIHVDFDWRAHRVLAACADAKVRVYQRHSDHLELLQADIPCMPPREKDEALSFPPTLSNNGVYVFTVVPSSVASRPDDRLLELYEIATGRRRTGRVIGVSQVIALSPQRNRVLNVGDDYARITEASMRSHRERLPHRGTIATAGFSGDGQLVATAGSDRIVRIWRANRNPFSDVVLNASRPCTYVIPHQEPVIGLAWSERRLIATVQSDGLLRIWRLPDQEVSARRPEKNPETSSGSAVTLSEGDWPLNGLVAAPPVRMADANVARFSPDGGGIVLDCQDGQARVLRWPSGKLDSHDLPHQGRVLDGVFTHDGKYILTLGSEGLLKVWHGSSGELALHPIEVNVACERIELGEDGLNAVLTSNNKVVGVIDLRLLAPVRSTHLPGDLADNPERQQLFAELVSGKRLHAGGLVNLSTQQWLDRWHRYRRLP